MNSEHGTKKKITLSIAKDVVEQARNVGIKNISQITENALKTASFSKEKCTKDDLINMYEAFFRSTQSQLRKYGCSIKVGYIKSNPDEPNHNDSIIRLYENTLKIEDQNSVGTKTTVADVYPHLDDLKSIMENLLPTLINAARENKERIQELELALRFFNAMSN